MKTSQQAFTLIELMITVAIVAILAAIAYPAYTSQVLRSHRTDARNTLLQIQVAQEKYFLQNNKYATTDALITTPTTASPPGLGITAPTYYTVSFGGTATNTSYTATATATGAQAKDTACLTFSIDQTGNKTPTGSNCWTR